MGRSKNAASKILTLFLCFSFNICAAAEDYKMKDVDAFKILQNASCVESRFVGEGGGESKIFKAFSVLSSKENANDLFVELYDKSNADAGKIYSLFWFFSGDKNSYFKHKNELLSRKNDAIQIKISDILYDLTLSEIFQKIENGELFIYLGVSSLMTDKKDK